MPLDQILVFVVLAATLAMFIHGRLRYDVIALLALLATAVLGLVPPEAVFSGFGHPAVITVAAVLVISYALQNSGLVDLVAGGLGRLGGNEYLQLVALTALVTVLSAFMNNVGALALLMPVTIQLARKHKLRASRLLMPLAFGSLFGGLITAIGTPANIIVANYRGQAGADPFRMFEFAPVGAGVALACLAFIWLLGWRLLPVRATKDGRDEMFDIEAYLTELRVPEESKWSGKSLREAEDAASDAEITIVGVVRGEQRMAAPSGRERLRDNDVLIAEADADDLKLFMDKTGFELNASEEPAARFLVSDEIVVVEAIVAPDSRLAGRTAGQAALRRRYGVNLLAIARQGQRLNRRLHKIRLRPGDVLLLQGEESGMPELLKRLGCLPLAERALRIGNPRRVMLALGIFGTAIALAATGILPIAIAFTAAVVAMVLTGLLALRDIYENIEWPVIVLLAAMIPVGAALETTGAAAQVAGALLSLGDAVPPVLALVVLMVVTMTLSDIVNNAAAAVLMAPVAVSLATGLGVAMDPFLMAVAVGASAAFMTPIGHQSNTLVMGPGGYRFGDYWKLGLPVSLVYLGAAVPLILWAWPL